LAKENEMPQKQPDKPSEELIHYNANARKFAKSGKVERSAEKAREAIDDPKQSRELKEAERKGKAKARSS